MIKIVGAHREVLRFELSPSMDLTWPSRDFKHHWEMRMGGRLHLHPRCFDHSCQAAPTDAIIGQATRSLHMGHFGRGGQKQLSPQSTQPRSLHGLLKPSPRGHIEIPTHKKREAHGLNIRGDLPPLYQIWTAEADTVSEVHGNKQNIAAS